MSKADDTIWVLREASKLGSFVPNEASVAEFAKSLERRGWLYRSNRGPYWEITPEGHLELARLEAEQ